MDDFVHDPRRVLEAAYRRVTHARSGGPLRASQALLLAEAIRAYNARSPELGTLHDVYRMALVIIGKDAQWRDSSKARSALYRLERAYDLAG